MYISNLPNLQINMNSYFITNEQKSLILQRSNFALVGIKDKDYYFVKTKQLVDFVRKNNI